MRSLHSFAPGISTCQALPAMDSIAVHYPHTIPPAVRLGNVSERPHQSHIPTPSHVLPILPDAPTRLSMLCPQKHTGLTRKVKFTHYQTILPLSPSISFPHRIPDICTVKSTLTFTLEHYARHRLPNHVFCNLLCHNVQFDIFAPA